MSEPHVLPLRTYLNVFGALLLLTAVTTGVAYLDLGFLNTAVALTIASVKMFLVVLFFMHVKYSSRVIWVFAGAGLVWFVILLGFTLNDYATRTPVPGWGG